jgi:molecular chaperone GrpE
VTDRTAGRRRASPPAAGSETEVDEPVTEHQAPDAADDISGVDNFIEEGAPLEPGDLGHDAPSALTDEVGELPEEIAEPEVAQVQQALAERTADLQRLQAEYVNYKRRVDRDRELVRENATYTALAPIVDVLDTIDRARQSAESLGGELDAGFQAVADQLERVVAGAGLVKYGEPGDPFDPRLHEALSHIGEDPDVEVTTCKVIAKAGYRIGERVVRAAQVLVVDPTSGG